MATDKPAFEVIVDGHSYRIWADGRHEGFSGRQVITLNRIPVLIAEAISRGRALRTAD